MHMLTAKTKNIIVSIFYDMHGAIKPSLQDKWAYQLLLHSVKIAFEVKYVQVFQFLSDEGTKTSVSVSFSDSYRHMHLYSVLFLTPRSNLG